MIPQRLIIDGLEWQVDVKDLSIERYGECRHADCHIVLGSRFTDQIKEGTFWHEVFHAMASTRALQCPAGLDASEIDEWIATSFGPALYSFLLANAKVIWNEHCFRTVESS